MLSISSSRGRWSIVLAVVGGIVGVALWAVTSWAASKVPANPNPDRSRYGFESDTMGWKKETYVNSRAVTSVAQSADRARLGKHSLKLTVDLRGGHANLSKGEAFVEVVPIQNLRGRAITAWVYTPAAAAGDPQRPNGLQLFVKSGQQWDAEYGAWQNIAGDSWQQVTLTPSTSTPEGGWKAEGFDPGKIRSVGIKIGAGGGSQARYRGPIYLDAVNW